MTPRLSLADAQDAVVAEMADLPDHLARYEYLVRVGKAFPGDESIRQDEHQVPGCQSRVWIVTELEADRLRIRADSDAMITRGIIALLVRVLDDRPPEEIAGAELWFLDRTGLRAHLSPSRANGLAAMVCFIREQAGGSAPT